jgi:hypothetical protein
MNLIAALLDELAPSGLRLRKAAPRGSDRLTLELDGADGRVCAGQWHADAAEARRIAAQLRKRFGDTSVDVLGRGHLLVQHAGTDAKLTGLHRLVTRPGAQLVAHRPERRAVVRLGDTYVKVVRPGTTANVVAPLAAVRPPGLRIPEVLDADDERGLVTVAALTGRTLLDRMADPTSDDEELATWAKQVGVALRVLHRHHAETPRLAHDGAAETVAAKHWLEAASRYGLVDAGRWRPRLQRVGAVLDGVPPELALLHRDLHDKQILLQPGQPVGLLDLDLATYGDPALDLANLLVHLDLRARQGVCSEQRAAACSAALVGGYSPDRVMAGRLAGYASASRLRLAGVYSFRDSPPGLVDGLLDASDEELSPWR